MASLEDELGIKPLNNTKSGSLEDDLGIKPLARSAIGNDLLTTGGIGTGQIPTPDVLQAAARGAGKGITLGAEPVLAGALNAAPKLLDPSILGAIGTGQMPSQVSQAYTQGRDSEIDKNAAAQKAHPIVFGASQIAGSIPTSMAASGLMAGTALNAPAVVGGATGLGNYLGDSKTPTLKGAAVNTAGGIAAANLLGKLGSAMTPATEGEVQDAVRNVSPKDGNFSQAYKFGRAGDDLNKEDLAKDIVGTLESNRSNIAAEKANILDQNADTNIDLSDVLKKAQGQADSAITVTPEQEGDINSVLNTLKKNITTQDNPNASFELGPDKTQVPTPMSLKKADALRQALGNTAYEKNISNSGSNFASSAYANTRNTITDSVPELASNYDKSNNLMDVAKSLGIKDYENPDVAKAINNIINSSNEGKTYLTEQGLKSLAEVDPQAAQVLSAKLNTVKNIDNVGKINLTGTRSIAKDLYNNASGLKSYAGFKLGNLARMSDEGLKNLGESLLGNPDSRNVAQSLLDAIVKNDVVKKNAAIFTIMQNPKIKRMLDNVSAPNDNNGRAPQGSTKYSY